MPAKKSNSGESSTCPPSCHNGLVVENARQPSRRTQQLEHASFTPTKQLRSLGKQSDRTLPPDGPSSHASCATFHRIGRPLNGKHYAANFVMPGATRLPGVKLSPEYLAYHSEKSG
jgi:hypothetical protein